MKQIKFTHLYEKIRGIDTSEPVTLIQVWNTNTSELTDEFIEYDSVYFENREKKNYPLYVPMACMVLFFVDSKGKLFTTVRRTTPTKEAYYNTSIGCDFEVVYKTFKF